MNDTVLRVENLIVKFPIKQGRLFSEPAFLHAVDDVSFHIERGKTLALVGESGSGKTTTVLAIARLIPAMSGRVYLRETELLALEGEELRAQRRRMQFIFQDPYSSLNPRLRADMIVREPLDRLQISTSNERAERVRELFGEVGLRPEQARLFPHQFSGGQRQRLGIARALASKPELVICDEPVSALDVAVQAQILNLLARLQADMGLTYLFISHDLGVVQHMCDYIAVMYMGHIVEYASRNELFTSPRHPYTQALLSAVPSAHPGRHRRKRILVTGDPASPINPPPGCRFASRCPTVEDRCRVETPPLRTLDVQHQVACHLVTN